MQSRLAIASIAKSNRFLIGFPWTRVQPSRLVTIPTGKAADPAIHAVNPEETKDASEGAKAAPPTSDSSRSPDGGDDPYEMRKTLHPSSASSPKIQSTGVKQPIDPIVQQKRRASSANINPSSLDVNCAGLDGSHWPEDRKDRREERKDQEEDDKEYYEHHKASPLSEIEIGDSRKPTTNATDGTADSKFSDYGTGGVLLWRPEQIDTAEDSLHRAMEIWKQNATRGDPDSPHGRVLRALRGDYW